jgi:hypothetical protein
MLICPENWNLNDIPQLSEITTAKPFGEQGCVNTRSKAIGVIYNFGIVHFSWVHRERCQNRLSW